MPLPIRHNAHMSQLCDKFDREVLIRPRSGAFMRLYDTPPDLSNEEGQSLDLTIVR